MSAILDRIAGQTIPRAFLDTVAARGDAVALRWKDGDDWQEMTFAEYRDLVARAAAGLRALGVNPWQPALLPARHTSDHSFRDTVLPVT